MRENSFSARARISGTYTESLAPSLICAHSSGVNEFQASRMAARIAAIGLRSPGCRANASTIRVSMSSWRTTSSFVGK